MTTSSPGESTDTSTAHTIAAATNTAATSARSSFDDAPGGHLEHGSHHRHSRHREHGTHRTHPRTGSDRSVGDAHPSTGEPHGESGLIVHLLRVSEHAAAAARDEALLDTDERARAARFLRDADRDRYRVAHVALRRELGTLLGTEPADITFIREPCPCCGEPHGRPAVPGNPVHFSLSHAHDLVMIAFAARPVGVDVERLPPLEVVERTSAALHPAERTELAALPPGDRPAAFTRCWTRKEAYLKGTGSGLGEAPSITYVGTAASPAAVPGWALENIPVPEGYAAAAATAAFAIPRPRAPRVPGSQGAARTGEDPAQ